MEFPTITLEEHFLSKNTDDGRALPASASKTWEQIRAHTGWLNKLKDVSPNGSRIKAMDAGRVGMQVLSNSFGVSSSIPSLVAAANDELSAATVAQPRFKGFASLPMKHPSEAVRELERCVSELGFVGALIDSHQDDGRYYDDREVWPVFAKAEELDVPIYIHPTIPMEGVQSALYDGNYDNDFGLLLGIAGWGWHCDTALSILRMYGAGLFNAYPKLKVVIGHMGEMLPFMLDRIDEKVSQLAIGQKQSFREVWAQNIWVTTSGMFTLAPMACLLQTTALDRILYSVDYPYSTTEQGRNFLQLLEQSGTVTREHLEMIAYKNAAVLLKLDV
ncbi:hypothetical protein PFICI_03240 [Pestalotiopsis fici W106-1]|uniref:Amidohydrolase-related domain-containing protein n=1 Tax=Pestalotiopsis fici (strain W106-1 / CGMCC3.15140) TaxID=1229662 RepID=W3XGR6_PESFW|nr:uncharacterized protein PFICI_03240 [Pestalotiopsis fici W106-1]ETS85215.1 hypothetical protein PFICI_03240 [Pestalotiopsis fici W106-1]